MHCSFVECGVGGYGGWGIGGRRGMGRMGRISVPSIWANLMSSDEFPRIEAIGFTVTRVFTVFYARLMDGLGVI